MQSFTSFFPRLSHRSYYADDLGTDEQIRLAEVDCEIEIHWLECNLDKTQLYTVLMQE